MNRTALYSQYDQVSSLFSCNGPHKSDRFTPPSKAGVPCLRTLAPEVPSSQAPMMHRTPWPSQECLVLSRASQSARHSAALLPQHWCVLPVSQVAPQILLSLEERGAPLTTPGTFCAPSPSYVLGSDSPYLLMTFSAGPPHRVLASSLSWGLFSQTCYCSQPGQGAMLLFVPVLHLTLCHCF